ncbi:PTS system glucose-specific IIA component [Paenibacillus anaericanus]|uniref:PTS sugar transporter subunit IIA n=1 Tax=Paenibacillus anaericanus TaxID=170367 RepID=UPI0027896C4D|nr:PTS glucose transporter subunit IIA [Paenibacillus anaericanus]MDQ0088625.1 PTS system glucose-specific IIA component [Paenibacillus anaericanus]
MFSKWRKKSTESQVVDIYSPVTGNAVPLANVPDEAFAGGHMGKGVAIEPLVGQLIAPFDGTVAHVIKSNHAVMLEHASGLQFLFHIGINTVSLKGDGFTSHISTGDKVKAGQVLIEFDIEKIKGAGYPIITPIIVTNADEVTSSIELFNGPVKAGSDVILKAVIKS